eukprot:3412184-Rhodomonas_salina.1
MPLTLSASPAMHSTRSEADRPLLARRLPRSQRGDPSRTPSCRSGCLRRSPPPPRTGRARTAPASHQRPNAA